MKDDKLIDALDGIDDEILADAAPRSRASRMPAYRIVAIAACLTLVVGVALGAGLMGGSGGGVTAPPVVERPFPEVSSPTKSLAAVVGDYLLSAGNEYPEYGWDDDMPDGGVDEGGSSGDAVLPEGGGSDSDSDNGSYVETTDNQVAGIIEADLYKTTDKYIFRYGQKSLKIYSIDGDNSREISSLYISSGGSIYYSDMFLSADGNTVTLIQEEYVYRDECHPYAGSSNTFIYSIDVSDVNNPRIARTLSVAGRKLATRKIGDKIYLVTSVGFDKAHIDDEIPETYIPGVVEGGAVSLCDTDNIFYKDEICRVSYVYATVFSEGDLSLYDEYAVLTDYSTWVSGVYFTENHIAVEYQTGRQIREEDGYSISEAYTELELIDFSLGTLRYRGNLKIRGWAETGQYSYDERDGYLRVVTSTREWKRYWVNYSSAALYVYDLSTMTLTASVEDFAPEGERATAVRFEGEKLYVCTAETSSFTDPVFFFDLSDYENITEVNTGYIEGFSSSLIDFGEGYLLGVGRENRTQGKIEVYRREGDAVVSFAEFLFYGTPGSEYKSYLIDREKNIFGFACSSYRENQGDTARRVYLILQLDEGGLRVLRKLEITTGDITARAFLRDGYLYFTGDDEFLAVKLDI